jgi:hypothetical protein
MGVYCLDLVTPVQGHIFITPWTYLTAGNRHKQNSRFCKEIREDNFRFWWRRVHEDASQGMYMSKIEICFFTFLLFLLFYFFTPTKTGSYPHEFLCRTVCSACVDYQPCIFITQDKRASLGCSHAAQLPVAQYPP